MSARRHGHTDAARVGAKHLFRAAAVSYGANCALGTAVATGRLDTSGFRWVHHVVFVCTVLLSGAAAGSALWSGSDGARRAALALAPAAVPFVLIPRISAKSPRHIAVALTAAPFVLGAAALAGR